jgi:G3E family GTPase
MKPIRFLMIGGFLGAGKTTTIARLARHYMTRGLQVGLVTNDQAYDLVDTHSLRAQGFRVGEVPGACFCCKFDDLVDTTRQLQDAARPDIVLAEPVGSCTDLVATVVEPLRHLHGDRYEIGPLAVLLKPEHGQKILRREASVGFSPKAAYIFLKQLEEAQIVAINKIDKLSTDERAELIAGKQVLPISARHGEGFDPLIAALDRFTARQETFMAVDYDLYAEGEAELGWLNCQIRLHTAEADAFALDDVLIALVSRLRDALVARQAEPAHLKVLGQVGTDTGIANLVGSQSAVELSLASEIHTVVAELILNARVAIDPEQLDDAVRAVLVDLSNDHRLTHEIRGMQRFRPGRPQPTHRFATASPS